MWETSSPADSAPRWASFRICAVFQFFRGLPLRMTVFIGFLSWCCLRPGGSSAPVYCSYAELVCACQAPQPPSVVLEALFGRLARERYRACGGAASERRMRAVQAPRDQPRETVFAASRAKGDAFGPGSVFLAPSRGIRSPHVPRRTSMRISILAMTNRRISVRKGHIRPCRN